MSNELEGRIADKKFNLPLLPGVASEVMSLCSSPDTDAARLSEVLHRDQSFASHILRVANSPAMMPKVPIVSLQQAVSRLGMGQISEIAMAISVKGKVFPQGSHGQLVSELWQHSLATACLAKEIARLRRRNVEGAFLCGLLHDVGKPIILDALAELQKSSGEELSSATLVAAMDQYHPEVGHLLVTEWGLPQLVAEAVQYHHSYDEATAFGEAAMIACLSNMMAHALFPTVSPESQEELAQHQVVADLNLYPDDMHKLFGHAESIAKMVEAIL